MCKIYIYSKKVNEWVGHVEEPLCLYYYSLMEHE